MKITDYQRQLANTSYAKLINKYGMEAVLRHIELTKSAIWGEILRKEKL